MKIKKAAKSGTGSCTLKSGAVLRELVGCLATGLIVGFVLWTCILGMAGAYETTDIRLAEVSDGR